jgi:hypothetical protein
MQLSQVVMSTEGLTTSQLDSKSKAALTTTLNKGAASTQTQTLILENVPQTIEEQSLLKSSAKIGKTKGLAKSQAVVASHHMGVNTNFQQTLIYTDSIT